MIVLLFLILIFDIFKIVALVTWLALAPVVVIHIVFERLTDFIFLPLRPLVLSAPPMLLHPCRHLLSGIIVWVIFVAVTPCVMAFLITIISILICIESVG
jgi:hypothetical protein